MGWKADTDPDAIHDNEAGEIQAVTEKATPVTDDLVLIEDSEDGFAKVAAKLGNLPGGGGGSGGGLTLVDSWDHSTDVASITFTGISSTHKRLLLICYLRSDRSGVTPDGVDMQLGDGSIDSTSKYGYTLSWWGSPGNGGDGATRDGDTVIQIGRTTVAPAGDTAGILGFCQVDIDRYATSAPTHVTFAGHRIAGNHYRMRGSGEYSVSNVVDQLKLVPHFGSNFTAGRVELYGVD